VRRRTTGTLLYPRCSFRGWAVLQTEDPSAWRNIRKCRQLKRPVGRPRKHPVVNEFYAYPAKLIAKWCCVALSTAHAYKSGRLKPGTAAQKLFCLDRER
jgi:hypothetical protein